jgi:hypothetical protein
MVDMALFVIGMLVWLQVKHFIADYLLQPPWILRGKGDLGEPGGYVHAGIHVCGSLPVLIAGGLSAGWISALMAAEFVIHYLADHIKAVHSHTHPHPTNTLAFWALHGADQLMHHLTYSAMLLIILLELPKSTV